MLNAKSLSFNWWLNKEETQIHFKIEGQTGSHCGHNYYQVGGGKWFTFALGGIKKTEQSKQFKNHPSLLLLYPDLSLLSFSTSFSQHLHYAPFYFPSSQPAPSPPLSLHHFLFFAFFWISQSNICCILNLCPSLPAPPLPPHVSECVSVGVWSGTTLPAFYLSFFISDYSTSLGSKVPA